MKKLLIILALIPVLSFGQVEFITDTKGLIKVRPPAGNCDTTKQYNNTNRLLDENFWFKGSDSTYNIYLGNWSEPANFHSVLVEDSSVSVDGKRLITLDDFLQYADECYRDSTVNGWGWTYWAIGKDTPETIYADSTWIHKEPTFPGFMKWLEKK